MPVPHKLKKNNFSKKLVLRKLLLILNKGNKHTCQAMYTNKISDTNPSSSFLMKHTHASASNKRGKTNLGPRKTKFIQKKKSQKQSGAIIVDDQFYVDYKKVNILTFTPCRPQTKFELHTNNVVQYFKTYLLFKCPFFFS